MTTHKIELPQGYAERPFDYSGDLYTEGQVRAIIEADRERRSEPEYLISACYFPNAGEVELSWERKEDGAKAALTCKVTPEQGKQIADVVWPCVYHTAAPQTAEPSRGEPVAWLRKNGFRFNAEIEPRDDSELPLYTAPQPAEPVKKKPYAQGTALGEFGIIPMCDQVNDEPVKVPSDAISVVGVPEFDALMDHIYENGTASEGVLPLANAFARALLARYGKGTP